MDSLSVRRPVLALKSQSELASGPQAATTDTTLTGTIGHIRTIIRAPRTTGTTGAEFITVTTVIITTAIKLT